MLELLGQVCLVVVRTALLNLACWVRLSNYWIGLLVGLFVSGLIVLVWSALVQAVLFSLVWSVLAGLFWLVPLVCTALVFSRLCPPGRFWRGLVFRVSPLALDPIFSDMFCSALVWSTLTFSH